MSGLPENTAPEQGLQLPTVDVRALRAALALSQNDFAMRYGIPVAALRNWEQQRRNPDTTANIYLHLVRQNPEAVASMLEVIRQRDSKTTC